MEPKYIWNLKQKNEKLVEELSEKYKMSTIMATILANRNIVIEKDIVRFLNADKDKFYDPYLMEDMDKAVERIITAIDKNEKITIYGDYDVDGITSTSVLYMYLKENAAQVDYYIPNRLEEGYGVNDDAVKSIHQGGTKLIITVDTGITAISQVDLANSLGLDMVITDHHECQESIPDAVAVIDPKREDCRYPFDMLAGVGVAFKVIHALSIKLGNIDSIWKYLDIVAVGTVADIVPLKDENRIITKLAFETMKDTWNVGLKSLIKISGNKKDDKITAGIIGFRIAPRLNAAGRLGDAKRGIELFITEDKNKAADIAEKLNEENILRQQLEQEIFDEAVHIIEENIDMDNTKIIVAASSNWHHGVIGIVASRITEKYYKPSILLSIEDGVATGSARSVDGFSIFEALCSTKELFMKFGGHEMAAGMSLKEENIDRLREVLNEYAENTMESDTLIPKLTADMEIDIKDISIPLIEEIIKLEPYGVGNPEPKFICKGKVDDVRKIGKESNHLKMRVDYNKNYLDGIGFGMAQYYDYINVTHDISLLGTLNINEWNGTKKPQIMLKDINPNNEFAVSIKRYYDEFNNIKNANFDGKTKVYFQDEQVIPTRKEFENIYRTLLNLEKQMKENIIITKFLKILGYSQPNKILTLLICLEVFSELRLLEYRVENMRLIFKLNKGIKVKLDESSIYKKII
ncbi:single-stranded-DNA-specific exonuclease RecJ [Vallitalea maricola]|uniref:Single-stranded-DNA-specific exonuclease RecJ n=1 Tax=Vallitalea maricola TaxID=3074433 RepID=A0ACB5ULA7_9FIRM|nr:single-stranded-DNA-specific exonuclease RecJ [Vallitalea sp. AN17-2]